MRKLLAAGGTRQSGLGMIGFLIALGIVIVVGGIFYIGIDGVTCEGQCASVQCTNASPCPIDTDGDGKVDECIVGTVCTAAAGGTICEDNWWWFDDCICANQTPTPGACKAVCVKP